MAKKFITVLAFIVAALILGATCLWLLLIKPLVQDRFNKAVSQYVTPSKEDDLQLFLFGVKSSGSVYIPSKPIAVPLDKPRLELSFFSLLSLKPKINFNSGVFGGKLSADASINISDRSIYAQVELEQLKLADIQLLRMLGVSAGQVFASVKGKALSNSQFSPSTFSFLVKDLIKEKPSKLPPWVSKIPITVPAINLSEFEAQADCNLNYCQSNRFLVTSSLGQASGHFLVPIDPKGEVKADLTISLTQAGRNELLPYVAILNQDLLKTPERPFQLSLSGTVDRPKLSVVTIQNSL